MLRFCTRCLKLVKVKKLIKTLLIILIFAEFLLGMYFIYPGILWDANFLGHELFFNINKVSFKGFSPVNIPRCPDCNVVLLSLDTLRADRLSCYGYYRATSPNIDKMAEESILFKETFSNGYFTMPSHMSILTSLYPLTHKINNQESEHLPLNFKTFAEIMKEEGYRTVWVGPLDNPHLNLTLGFERGFDEFYSPLWDKHTGYNKTLFSNIFEKNLDRQFFLFVHSYINHGSYIYTDAFNYKFSNPDYSGNLPKNMSTIHKLRFIKMKEDFKENPQSFFNAHYLTSEQKNELEHYLISDNLTGFNELIQEIGFANIPAEYHNAIMYYSVVASDPSEPDLLELSNSYDNGVFYVDSLFSEFLDELKQYGLLENTIIIITADHGEELFEHGGVDHSNFYDHTISVPLIINLPGLQKKVEVKELAQSVDILPTTLNLLGIMPLKNLQGKNLLQILENKKETNEYVFGYSFGNMYVRSKKWKYMVHNDGREELYYLVNDPLEQNNLINKRSIVINKYRKRLDAELTKWVLEQALKLDGYSCY